MSKYKIAYIPGDGTGPELMDEGLKILKAIQETTPGINLEFSECDAGAETYLKTGSSMPEEAWLTCKESDSIYKAPVGLPGVTKPDGTEAIVDVILGLRFKLDLYVNLRPAKLYLGVRCPLAGKKTGDIDYFVVRENTEGLYAQHGGIMRDEVATNIRVITRKGCERIVRYAFDYARKTGCAPSDRKKRVTCVDKSNVLVSDVFFRNVYNDVAKNYGDVEKDYAYVDAFTQWQVLRPENFHVVVIENMFGDIVSDLAAATVGSLGLAPGANIGDRYAVFEPVHGSAPKYKGQRVANPIATILAGKMMIQWLGEKHSDAAALKASQKIEKAVEAVLAEGKVLTHDLGGRSKTNEVGDEIARKIKEIS